MPKTRAHLLAPLILVVACSKAPTTEPTAAPAPTPVDEDSEPGSELTEPDPTTAEPAEPALDEATLTLGAAAYAKGMCGKCHGDDGAGNERGPDLTDDQWQHGDGSVAGILEVLRRGVPKEELADPSRPFGMNPATKLVEDPAQLQALAAYVWSLSRA